MSHRWFKLPQLGEHRLNAAACRPNAKDHVDIQILFSYQLRFPTGVLLGALLGARSRRRSAMSRDVTDGR
jgi:hypothetical protein